MRLASRHHHAPFTQFQRGAKIPAPVANVEYSRAGSKLLEPRGDDSALAEVGWAVGAPVRVRVSRVVGCHPQPPVFAVERRRVCHLSANDACRIGATMHWLSTDCAQRGSWTCRWDAERGAEGGYAALKTRLGRRRPCRQEQRSRCVKAYHSRKHAVADPFCLQDCLDVKLVCVRQNALVNTALVSESHCLHVQATSTTEIRQALTLDCRALGK